MTNLAPHLAEHLQSPFQVMPLPASSGYLAIVAIPDEDHLKVGNASIHPLPDGRFSLVFDMRGCCDKTRHRYFHTVSKKEGQQIKLLSSALFEQLERERKALSLSGGRQ